jgi:transposase
MKEQEIKGYQRKTQRDYSLGFKLKIVDAVEKAETSRYKTVIHLF